MKKFFIKSLAAISLWVICSAAVFWIAGCAHASSYYECSSSLFHRAPTQKGYWSQPPNIIICPSAPVTIHRVQKALDFWEKMGYTFGTVHAATKEHMGCVTGTIPMYTIMIDLPSQEFDMQRHVGHARVGRYVKTGEIVQVKIEVMYNSGPAERIMEHEIGHALGWDDVHQPGHIMHKLWENGGYGAEGLKNRRK